MEFQIINQILESFIILKVAILVLILFHFVFLFVVNRQVKSMNRVISQGVTSTILEIITIIALIASIALFAAAVVIL